MLLLAIIAVVFGAGIILIAGYLAVSIWALTKVSKENKVVKTKLWANYRKSFNLGIVLNFKSI